MTYRGLLKLTGSLVTLLCSSAFAEPQALVTVNPNLFAPGQNLSNATPGATLRSVVFIPNPDPNAPPQQAAIPQYSPVFAQAITPNCILETTGVPPPLPCAPIGNSVFSYTSSPVPQSYPTFWGDVRHALDCFSGNCFGLPTNFAPLLRIDFAVPTDSVSVILANFASSDGDLEAFTTVAAFDDTGQNIGTCTSGAPGHGPGCSGVIVVGPDFDGASWMRVTFSDPGARIRFIVTGATTDLVPVGVVQFDSPVSVQLAGLLAQVQGVGPGTSLADKVIAAQTYYAVPDIQSTCATLTGFVSEVTAQRGKTVANLIALQLLSTATAIETALGCGTP